MNIRMKLLALIFVSILLAGGITTIIARVISTNTVEDEINDRLETVAHARARHIETDFENSMDRVDLFVEQAYAIQTFLGGILLQDTQNNAMLNILQGMIESSGEIDMLLGIDENGLVFISLDEQRFPIGTDLSASEIFARGRETTCVGISDIEGSDRDLKVYTAAPFYVDPGKTKKGVSVFLGGQQGLFEITTDITGLGETGEVYLVNENGYMITPSRFLGDDALLKQQIDMADLEGLSDNGESIDEERNEGKMVSSRNYLGIKVLRVHTQLPDTGWTAIAEISESEAYKPVSTLTNSLLWGFFGILIFGAVVAILISRSMSKPITSLRRGAEAIMKGNWEHDVSTSAKDEVGELSRTFSRMTANLRKSQEELQRNNENLEGRVIERTHELSAMNEV